MGFNRKGKRELVKNKRALVKAHAREFNRIDKEIEYIVTLHNIGEIEITEDNIYDEVAKVSDLKIDNMEKLLILHRITNEDK